MSVAELERKFNPGQLRDPGGEGGGRWIKNPGSAGEAAAKDAAGELVADELDLSWQIELNPGEQLVASNAFYQRGGDYELDAAIIKTRGGHEVRLGVTHEDESWPGDSTDTLHLEVGQFRQLHADLSNAATEGKKAAAEADRAWSRGMQPTDPRLLGSKAIAEGVVTDGGTDLNWDVFVTDDDPTSWQLNVGVADGGELTLNPVETAKLLKFLQGLDAYIGTPDAARAYSQEVGQPSPPAAGPPKGGQFAKGGGRVTGKGRTSKQRRPAGGAPKRPTPPDPNLSFDGQHGTGYGIKGGDARVRTLQAALNRLGLTDSSGNELAVDGRYGPRTTSSVKKLQKALGLPADGKVTPELLKQVADLKQLPPKPPAKRRSRRAASASSSSGSRRNAPTRRSRVLAAVSRALGEHRVVDGMCVTCDQDDDTEDHRAVRSLVEALDEISRLRHVRTEAGARKYGVPIGSVIGGGARGPSTPHVPQAKHAPAAPIPATPHTPSTSANVVPETPAKASTPKRATVKDRLVSAINDHIDGKGDGDPLKGFSREQLRKVAKERGVALNRGEDRNSIATKLIAHARGGRQSEAPKAEPKPAKAAVKAPARPVKKPAAKPTKSTRLTGSRAKLAATVEHGTIRDEQVLSGGAVGDTRLRTYDDGTKTVWKASTDYPGAPAQHQADAEELSSLIAQSLGLRAPAVVRDGDTAVHMAFVDHATSVAAVERVDYNLPSTKEGRMMGLLDLLINNGDRPGNYLIPDSGGLVPIDHGLAFRYLDKHSSARPDVTLSNDFTRHFADGWNGEWRDNELTPADMAEIQRRLAGRKPEFDRLGRADWHQFMMNRLESMAPHAKGSTSVLLPEVA